MEDRGSGGSGVPVSKDALTFTEKFDKPFELMEKGVDKAVKAFRDLVAKVKELWPWLPYPVQRWINDNLKTLSAQLKKVLKHIKHAMRHYAPVISLIYVSFAWIDEVKTPASGVWNDITASEHSDSNLSYWISGAADEYKTRKTEQVNAVGAVRDNAEEASKWLMAIAKDNVAYAVELAKVVSEIAGDIAQAAVDAAAFNVPLVIDTLAGSVGTLVTAAFDAMLEIANRLAKAVSDERDLYSKRTDMSYFDNGEWPEAVTV